MFDAKHIEGRAARLDELAAGLGCEAGLWRESGPLSQAERRQYVGAVQDALAAAVAARVVLLRTLERLARQDDKG